MASHGLHKFFAKAPAFKASDPTTLGSAALIGTLILSAAQAAEAAIRDRHADAVTALKSAFGEVDDDLKNLFGPSPRRGNKGFLFESASEFIRSKSSEFSADDGDVRVWATACVDRFMEARNGGRDAVEAPAPEAAPDGKKP